MKKESGFPPLPQRKPREPVVYPGMTFDKVMNTIDMECGRSLVIRSYVSGKHKVVILPEAESEFRVMIGFGRRSPKNRKEQKYNGYGHFLDGGDGNVIIVVSHFIEVFTMNRSAVHASNLGPGGEPNPGLDFLEYYREEFLSSEKECNEDAGGHQADPFLDICGSSEFVLEGHTHPNLGVFWSPQDRKTGSARAASSPVCIFVCDPVRREILGCVGKAFEEAEIVLCSRDNKPDTESFPPEPARETDSRIHVNELIYQAQQCISLRGCSGKIQCHTGIGGNLKVNLLGFTGNLGFDLVEGSLDISDNRFRFGILAHQLSDQGDRGKHALDVAGGAHNDLHAVVFQLLYLFFALAHAVQQHNLGLELQDFFHIGLCAGLDHRHVQDGSRVIHILSASDDRILAAQGAQDLTVGRLHHNDAGGRLSQGDFTVKHILHRDPGVLSQHRGSAEDHQESQEKGNQFLGHIMSLLKK